MVNMNRDLDLRPEMVKVLLVDDRPENLYALKEILRVTGYTIITSNSATEALKLMLNQEFACCLLDIRMPDIDGFEMAEMIRDDVKLQNVPIIFVTAEASDRIDVFKGYEKGAVDFLIKPLEPAIVRSKVKVFGQMYLQGRALEYSKQIEHLNQKLTGLNVALSAANRDLEHFTHIAAHDLREPTRKQLNFVDLLKEELAENTSPQAKGLLEKLELNCNHMINIVDDFRYLTKLSQHEFQRQEIDFKKFLTDCVDSFKEQITAREVNIQYDIFPKKAKVYTGLVERLYYNLISNIFNHVSKNKFTIHFTFEEKENEVFLGVKNTGSKIAADQLENIFKIFRRGDTSYSEGSGIGLNICKKIVDRHKGSIWAESGSDYVHIKFSLGDCFSDNKR